MTTESTSPSGQAPAQPASTTASGTASTPETTLLGSEASTTPEGKAPETAAKPDDAAKPADTAAKQTAPETYEFKFAEGVVVDQKALEAFTPIMREANLTQEQAQKLADVYASQVEAQNTAFAKQLEDEGFAVQQAAQLLAPHRDKWSAALKNDKEIGGAKFDANVQAMQKAVGRFGSPELKQFLNVTGLGNHPELARFCLKVGQAISEDNPTTDTQGGGARKAAEDVFYGGSNG